MLLRPITNNILINLCIFFIDGADNPVSVRENAILFTFGTGKMFNNHE
ncbi:hypothetical protein SAMN05421740_104259 [Parapedobacter koreensis]|uniref:Uncharacterized protein n=1 Tax=Parapedobacter koreensis TaxID=332977 RepID=A0A1H7PA90_9SPHI|nr:hypothetical protein SAMN05421740_104259 [Parapedobacter koreensis]